MTSMATLTQRLLDRLTPAFDALEQGADPVLRASDRADFQVNGAMALAKRLGRNPRDVAEEILATADLSGLADKVEIAGPGFINVTVSDEALIEQLVQMGDDENLGIPSAATSEIVVVDYSAPNVAKEMHVGHLRSTVIGDSICRMLELKGHMVIRRNHVGDWGTPFGMLIEHLLDLGEDEAIAGLSVGDLNGFYTEARVKFDADDSFKERSRQRVVALQSGDAETLRLWRILVGESVRYFSSVYGDLGVLLEESDVVGESFYNPMLQAVVDDLDAAGILVDSGGAACVFPPGFTNRDGEPLPLIVRKSDEGFGYAATDLAAVRNRVSDLGASKIYYVVGAPQAQHFEMIFAVATMAGWLTEDIEAVHVAFGSVLGPDRKAFKTREGGTVKLQDLLAEAVERARTALESRSPTDDLELVARQVAMGAIKFADLSTDRQRDYIFDWDRMLAFEGATGPYLQYAHARIRSIFRRVGDEGTSGTISLREPAERALARHLVALPDALDIALETLCPSKLCLYLFELAQQFTTFYETCPVLKAPDEETRASRLELCELTAATLRLGLGLLGIEAPEHM
jgi:arginyl-tRNA synthetase